MAGSTTFDGIKLTGTWHSADEDRSANRVEFAPVNVPRVAAMRSTMYPDRWITVTQDQLRIACPAVSAGRIDEVFRNSG